MAAIRLACGMALIACHLMGAPARSQTSSTEPPALQALNRQFVEAQLLGPPRGEAPAEAPLFRLIKDRAPDAFEALVVEVAAKLEYGGTEAEAGDIARRHMMALRQRLAAQGRNAPDAAVRDWLGHYIGFVERIAGEPTCGAFIFQGADSLTADQRARHNLVLVELATAQMRALFDGATVPTDQPASSDADMRDMFKEWFVAVGDRSMANAIAAQDPKDPRSCPAFLSFLRFLAAAGHDRAARARAWLLSVAAAS